MVDAATQVDSGRFGALDEEPVPPDAGSTQVDGVGQLETQLGRVETMRPIIGESDTESVYHSTPDHRGDEDIARVLESVVVEDALEDVEVTRATQAAFHSVDSVDLTVMFETV